MVCQCSFHRKSVSPWSPHPWVVPPRTTVSEGWRWTAGCCPWELAWTQTTTSIFETKKAPEMRARTGCRRSWKTPSPSVAWPLLPSTHPDSGREQLRVFYYSFDAGTLWVFFTFLNSLGAGQTWGCWWSDGVCVLQARGWLCCGKTSPDHREASTTFSFHLS